MNGLLAAIRAEGLPTSGVELNNYYRAVPDDQNAAIVMQQAFDRLQNYPDARSNEVDHIRSLSWRQSLIPEQRELLAGYVELNLNAMAKAEEGIKLPQCRYPIDFSWGADTKLPHLVELRKLALLEQFRAFNASDSNQPAIASAAVISILGMASTLDQEPSLISKLVRLAMLNIAIATLERGMNQVSLSESELRGLDLAFFKAVDTNQLADGLVGDRAMMIRYFRMTSAEIKRYSESSAGDNKGAQAGPQIPGSRPMLFRVTGFFERDLRFYLEIMETNISLAKMPPPKSVLVSNVEAELRKQSQGEFYIMSTMLLPTINSLITRDISDQAQVRTAQVALKIELYRTLNGHLPETLGELVPQYLPAVPIDPFDGQPLRFHHLDKGYVVYSVGQDGHDNGGRERPPDAKSSDQTEYDLPFTVER